MVNAPHRKAPPAKTSAPSSWEKLPAKNSVPLCTSTDPVLLKLLTSKLVVPMPADLIQMPALLMVAGPPPSLIAWSFWISNDPVGRLLKIVPTRLKPEAPYNHTAPSLLTLRV